MCAVQGHPKIIDRTSKASLLLFLSLLGGYAFLAAVLVGWVDVGQTIMREEDAINLVGLLVLDLLLSWISEVAERGSNIVISEK